MQPHSRKTRIGAGPAPRRAAITLLLRACNEAGSIQPGLDPNDVLLLTGFLWRIDDADWEARAARLLNLVMNGLRAGAPAK